MQLSPKIYHKLIRPQWFVKHYIESTLTQYFDYNNCTIIDFGCGVGALTPLFKTENYIGIDCDAKRIAYAKYLHPKYKFYTSVCNQLPLPDQSVDYIFFISVLHHIPSQDILSYFSEFQRVLKPHGKIVGMEPCITPHKIISNTFMKTFDKGKFIRTKNEYLRLFESDYHTSVVKQFSQLKMYNKILFSATPKEATI
jgi:ubiquinone/menaquinone biosynthesis C-methylase UbiE